MTGDQPPVGTGRHPIERVRTAWAAWDRFATKPLPRNLTAVLKGLVTLIIVLIMLGLVDGLAQPRVRESAKRAACKCNLRQIAIACHLYADENGGRFPDTFQELYPAFADNAKVFSCPSNPSSYADFAKNAVTEQSSSYTLVPGLRADMPGDFILAYDSLPANHADGHNVAFADGSVEWQKLRPGSQDEAAFRRRLAEQAERARNWKPPAAGAGGAPEERR